MRLSRLVSLLLIISLLSQPAFLQADDTENDFNATKTHVNAIQISNPNLPNVPQQRGRMGEIMSRLFDTDGKIGNWYLKALGTRQDGAVLRWTGGNGGRFMTGSIFDTGSNVSIQNQTTIGGNRYDAAGRLITRGTGKEQIILQTNDNNADVGIAFRNSGGAYTHSIYRTNIGSNNADLRIAGGQATSTIGNLDDYVTIEGGPSGGNVGIGLTDPGFKLDVSGDINFTGDLRKNGALYNPAGRFQDAATLGEIYYNGGFVGIGNNNPAQMLDVTGNANISGTLTVGNLNGDSITDASIDETELADGSVRTGEIQDGTIVNADINNAAAIAGTKISPNFGTQNISTTGNMGVGIAVPGSKLHVRNGTDENFRVGTTDILGLGGGVQVSSYNNAGDTNLPLGLAGSYIGLGNSGQVPTVFVDNVSGEVGIGTVATNEKLTVFGGISVTADPDSSDDVGDRGYNDGRYINVGETILGDNIQDNTIDESEIEDTFVARDSQLLDGIDSANFLRSDQNDTMNGELRLANTAHAPGANEYDMEISSPDTGDGNNELSLRFHQANRYYYQIRARAGGFRFTDGNDDDLTNISIRNPVNNEHAVTKSYADGLITNIPGDNIQDNTIDSSEIQNESIVAADIGPGSINSSELAGALTYTDNVGNANFRSLIIDHNATGSDALTTDRTHTALRLDLDSSASGGDTANEHRIYGIESDVDVSGDSDLVYGGYFSSNTTHSAGTISEVRGSYSYAASNSTAAVNNLRGSYNLAVDSANGSVANTVGSVSKALKDAGSTNTTATVIGLEAEAEIDAGTITNAYGIRSFIDRDGGTITNGYLFRGDYQGTLPTNAYGIYIDDNVRNFLAGGLQLATTTDASLSSVTHALTLGNTGGENLAIDGNEILARNNGANSYLHLSNEGGGITVNNTAAASARFRVEPDGDVGIGTNAPSQKLDVNGNVAAASFISSAANNNDVILEYEGGYDLLKQSSDRGGIALTSRDDSIFIGNGDEAHTINTTYFTPGSENLGIAADGNIQFFTDLQEGWGTHHIMTFDNTGNLTVPGQLIANGGIDGDSITDGTIDSSEIQNNTLTANDLATNSVGNDELINSPTVGELFITGTNYARLEMRDTDGTQWPYIDFSNDATTNFDMRMRLNGNDQILVEGGSLRVNDSNITVDRDLYIGENGAGNSDTFFYDDNSDTWRGLRWNNSNNRFEIEGNDGNYRRVLREGHSGDYIADGTIDSSEIQDYSITTTDVADNHFPKAVGTTSLVGPRAGRFGSGNDDASSGIGYNIFLGNDAGHDNTSGSNNLFLGQNAGANNTTGFNNVLIGLNAGSTNTTGNTNFAVRGNLPSATESNQINIVNRIYGRNNNVGIGSGNTNPTAALHVRKQIASQANPSTGLMYLENTGATWAGAHATLGLRTAGSAAGDPYVSFDIAGDYGWSAGIDNSDDNKFKIAGSWSSLTTRTRLTIRTNGQVGIGTASPGQRLDVNGNARADAFIYSSDRRLKENITEYTNGIEVLDGIKTVSYDWKDTEKGSDIGVIAQDVQKVFPEAVKEDTEGYLSVDYARLVVPVINTVKKQQKVIDSQQEIIEAQQKDIDMLKEKLLLK